MKRVIQADFYIIRWISKVARGVQNRLHCHPVSTNDPLLSARAALLLA